MHNQQKPTYYHDYLKLESLLNSQEMISKKNNIEAPDEMLFIITHQAYELWFKQMLHELHQVKATLSLPSLDDSSLAEITWKVERVNKIVELLISQIPILETMTPMDFLEFRDLLIPASGFQSVQFREIEILLGVNQSQRPDVKVYNFMGRLSKEHQSHLEKLSKEASISALVNNWLERIPYLKTDGFDFWKEYQNSVDKMFKRDEEIIKSNLTLGDEERKGQLINLEKTKETFHQFFDSSKNENSIFSAKSRRSALFILLYRQRPLFIRPFQFLQSLIDLDEKLTHWRQRHAELARRMLGTKIGTGGSSGHKYLKATAERNRVFNEISNLTTFLIPKSGLPKLPQNLKNELDYYFNG